MANKTIPQLPEQTGITDNDVLAIVDSGETTTSKIKVSTLLSNAGGVFEYGQGTDSIRPVDSGSPDSYSSGARSVILSKNANNRAQNDDAIAGGNNSRATGQYSMAMGGAGNTAQGRWSVIVGGSENNAQSNATFIGGGLFQTGGAYASIIGGRNNSMSTYQTAVGGGFSTGAGEGGVIIGGDGSTMRSSTGENPRNGNLMAFAVDSIMRRDNGSGTSNMFGQLNGLICTNDSEVNGQSGNESVRTIGIGTNDTDLTGGTTNTIALGTSGRTPTESYAVYGEDFRAYQHFIMEDYSNLDYASDAAAATGGVPLGGLYHNSGDVKVRTT